MNGVTFNLEHLDVDYHGDGSFRVCVDGVRLGFIQPSDFMCIMARFESELYALVYKNDPDGDVVDFFPNANG